ncbi:MAG: hypothetical protein ABR570_08530 [Burkholderiales bacterium]
MRLAAAALVALVSAAAQADELGRLFFTPEQRANLDLRRKARMPDKPAAPSVAAPVTRVDGYVKRSAGPSTVWINGESLGEAAPEAPRIDTTQARGGAVSLSVGDGGGRVRLRPGEALDRSNGEVRDVVGDGEIQIRPPGDR